MLVLNYNESVLRDSSDEGLIICYNDNIYILNETATYIIDRIQHSSCSIDDIMNDVISRNETKLTCEIASDVLKSLSEMLEYEFIFASLKDGTT